MDLIEQILGTIVAFWICVAWPLSAIWPSGPTFGDQLDSDIRSGRLSKEQVLGIGWLSNVSRDEWRWKDETE